MTKLKIIKNISAVLILIAGITVPTVSAISSITISATDSGGTVLDETTLSGVPSIPDEFTLSMPAGNNITFDLTINMGTASAIASYKGTALADISKESATVDITMGIERTRIVVPDPEWVSGPGPLPRILQFDDINDTSALSLDFSTLGPILSANSFSVNTFTPYDIDIDNQGRIYIANNDGSTGNGRVIRIDNISGLNAFAFKDWNSGIVSLTIDRENSIIYYIDDYNLYASNLDGTNDVLIEDFSTLQIEISGFSGITFSNGFIYIVDSSMATIYKYDIATKTIPNMVDANTITQLENPWDLIVKNDKLYVTNLDPFDDQIFEISTTDLSFTASFGNFVGSTDSSNIGIENFYGPRIFVGQMNEEITIIDDSPEFQLDKIIQIDNINGDSWTTLPSAINDDGQTLFRFFTQNVESPS